MYIIVCFYFFYLNVIWAFNLLMSGDIKFDALGVYQSRRKILNIFSMR